MPPAITRVLRLPAESVRMLEGEMLQQRGGAEAAARDTEGEKVRQERCWRGLSPYKRVPRRVLVAVVLLLLRFCCGRSWSGGVSAHASETERRSSEGELGFQQAPWT